jgi:hypothetical protein
MKKLIPDSLLFNIEGGWVVVGQVCGVVDRSREGSFLGFTLCPVPFALRNLSSYLIVPPQIDLVKFDAGYLEIKYD